MYDDICYDNSYRKEVVARIDFVAPLEELNKGLKPKLAKVLTTHFPISEPADLIAQELQLSGEEVVQHRQSRFKQWNFFGKEREKKLVLMASSLFVTFSRYTTYESMKTQFSAVVDAVGKSFPDVKTGRFGLRYVNVIEMADLATPTTWTGYIDPGLLGTMAFFAEPHNLTLLSRLPNSSMKI